MATISDNSGITLRDARHAHNFYTQNNHAFTPKIKFLYHVVFFLNDGVAPLSSANLTEIAVMAKTVDLPSFKANVETKQQYNRKKHLQTRIDYDPVRFVFHDDNEGLSRKMLEEYYTYYFRDGKKDGGAGVPTDFGQLDKYKGLNAKYGMDNDVEKPFFNYIKLFQFGRRNWYSYTLVNPLLTAWEHDSLDYSSSEPVQNTININYEGVLYNSGVVGDGGDIGFTSEASRYDLVPSPLGESTELYGGITDQAATGYSIIPRVTPRNTQTLPLLQRAAGAQSIDLNNIDEGALTGIIFPVSDSATVSTPANSISAGIPLGSASIRDPDEIIRRLRIPSNRSLLLAIAKRILASGYFNSDWNVSNFSRFDNLSGVEKESILDEILARMSTDIRMQTVASSILTGALI